MELTAYKDKKQINHYKSQWAMGETDGAVEGEEARTGCGHGAEAAGEASVSNRWSSKGGRSTGSSHSYRR